MQIAAANAGRQAWFTHVGLHPVKRRDRRVAGDDPRFAAFGQKDDYDQGFGAEVVAPLIAALDDTLAETIGKVTAGDAVSPEVVCAG